MFHVENPSFILNFFTRRPPCGWGVFQPRAPVCRCAATSWGWDSLACSSSCAWLCPTADPQSDCCCCPLPRYGFNAWWLLTSPDLNWYRAHSWHGQLRFQIQFGGFAPPITSGNLNQRLPYVRMRAWMRSASTWLSLALAMRLQHRLGRSAISGRSDWTSVTFRGVINSFGELESPEHAETAASATVKRSKATSYPSVVAAAAAALAN